MRICCSADYNSRLPDQTELLDESYYLERFQQRGISEAVIRERTAAAANTVVPHSHGPECSHDHHRHNHVAQQQSSTGLSVSGKNSESYGSVNS